MVWCNASVENLNLFAFRATDPADPRRTADLFGPENCDWFDRALGSRPKVPVVCAWGIHGEFLGQASAVRGWLDEHGIEPLCLGLTRDGQPKHLLYLPKAAKPVPFAWQLTRTRS